MFAELVLAVMSVPCNMAEEPKPLPSMVMLPSSTISQKLQARQTNHEFWCEVNQLLVNIGAVLRNPAHTALSDALMAPTCADAGLPLSAARLLQVCK